MKFDPVFWDTSVEWGKDGAWLCESEKERDAVERITKWAQHHERDDIIALVKKWGDTHPFEVRKWAHEIIDLIRARGETDE